MSTRCTRFLTVWFFAALVTTHSVLGSPLYYSLHKARARRSQPPECRGDAFAAFAQSVALGTAEPSDRERWEAANSAPPQEREHVNSGESRSSLRKEPEDQASHPDQEQPTPRPAAATPSFSSPVGQCGIPKVKESDLSLEQFRAQFWERRPVIIIRHEAELAREEAELSDAERRNDIDTSVGGEGDVNINRRSGDGASWVNSQRGVGKVRGSDNDARGEMKSPHQSPNGEDSFTEYETFRAMTERAVLLYCFQNFNITTTTAKRTDERERATVFGKYVRDRVDKEVTLSDAGHSTQYYFGDNRFFFLWYDALFRHYPKMSKYFLQTQNGVVQTGSDRKGTQLSNFPGDASHEAKCGCEKDATNSDPGQHHRLSGAREGAYSKSESTPCRPRASDNDEIPTPESKGTVTPRDPKKKLHGSISAAAAHGVENHNTTDNTALLFGVGAKGSGVPWHWHVPVFAEVLHGRKRWLISPPDLKPNFTVGESSLKWLRERYDAHLQEIAAASSSRLRGEADLTAMPYGDECNTLRHPSGCGFDAEQRVDQNGRNDNEDEASGDPRAPSRIDDCTLSPGEVLYLPDRWYHMTLNTELGVFMSTFIGAGY